MIGGEDGTRTRKDRDDLCSNLGITRRLAVGLKCASLLDPLWLFRCFCKDPSNDSARPGFTRAGFLTFPGELAELAQLPLKNFKTPTAKSPSTIEPLALPETSECRSTKGNHYRSADRLMSLQGRSS